ncbi:SURF1 family protein [Emcibacter sp.]|uniref:SURF1 family protein n=1 Tax=Emcibacter sp. TaxID=1979954 RepID=UPI002AA7C0A1|nr:SURF1 family protein [Emcibacter sp.]
MTKRISFRPRLWPTLITIPVFIILCLLGNWQVERLNWKLDLIEKLESRMVMKPTGLPDADVADARTLDAWEYRKVKVTGHFLHMREMTMYSIGPDGKPGYDLYTPLLNGDGRTVIVNRGWVPENLKQKTSRPVSITDGEVTITGVLRKPWGKAMLGPENEVENNNWYFGDLEQMAASQDLKKVFPMFLYADETPNAGGWPLGGRTRIKLANNHLGYVITWYGLALALFAVYMFYHVRFIPVDEHQE